MAIVRGVGCSKLCFLIALARQPSTFSNLEKKQQEENRSKMNGGTTVRRASTRRGSATKSCRLHLLKITPRVRALHEDEKEEGKEMQSASRPKVTIMLTERRLV